MVNWTFPTTSVRKPKTLFGWMPTTLFKAICLTWRIFWNFKITFMVSFDFPFSLSRVFNQKYCPHNSFFIKKCPLQFFYSVNVIYLIYMRHTINLGFCQNFSRCTSKFYWSNEVWIKQRGVGKELLHMNARRGVLSIPMGIIVKEENAMGGQFFSINS